MKLEEFRFVSGVRIPVAVLLGAMIMLLLIIFPQMGVAFMQCANPADCPPSDGTICFRYCTCPSPIVVDLSGKGFRLSSVQDGVRFDITGTGKPIQIAWTAQGADNAFLALDRNGN